MIYSFKKIEKQNNQLVIDSSGINDSYFFAAVQAWAKAKTKPTYTYTEVGAAANPHVHGSITNAGAITSNTALANGASTVITDAYYKENGKQVKKDLSFFSDMDMTYMKKG